MSIGSTVPLNTDRANIREEHHRELPHIPVVPGGGQFLACNRIGGSKNLQPFLAYRPDDADRQTRTRERVSPDDLFRQPEVEADLANFVLEECPQRFHQGEFQIVREATDVVMTLDVRRSRSATGFHDVGVQRPLDQKIDTAARPRFRDDLASGVFEDADELPPDDLALGLRFLDALERVQEALPRIHGH